MVVTVTRVNEELDSKEEKDKNDNEFKIKRGTEL